MRPVAIIQARTGSTRLPGKVLMPLAGEPSLWRIVERLRAVSTIDEVVIATTTSRGDDGIRDFCEERSIAVFSGSEEDVLDRFHGAAAEHHADPVIRITGDCPLVDPGVVAELIELYESSGCDHVGVVAGLGAETLGVPGYPDGLDAECFSMASLERAWRDATDVAEREHVTVHMWGNPSCFQCGRLTAPVDYSALRLTIDHPEDFELVSRIYDALQEPGRVFSFDEVIGYLADHPGIAQTNAEHVGSEKYRELFERLLAPPLGSGDAE